MKPAYLTRYLSQVVRHPVAVLAVVAAITVVLGLGATHVFVEVDPERQLPQSHPYVQSFHEVHRLFGDWNLVMIGLRPRAGSAFDTRFLEKVDAITKQIATLPGLTKPLLHGLASPNAKEITAENDTVAVRPLLENTTFASHSSESLATRVFADPAFIGTLVSYDGSALAIYATFELTRELPGYVNLHHAVKAILVSADDGTFEYYLSGPVVVASSLSTYAAQVAYLFPIALLVIGLVHYDGFRTWQAVALPLLTGGLAVIWAMGLMGYAGVPLDPLNSTTPVLILAVGAGHAVQLLKRYYESLASLGENRLAVIHSMSQIGPIMIAAGTIAALSFLSLATIGTSSMRTFGIFTGLGIIAAVIIEMSLIPALRATLSPSDARDWGDEARLHPRLDRTLRIAARYLALPSFASRVLLVYVAIVIGCAMLAARIEVDTSFKGNFAENDKIWTDDTRLNSLFAGTNSLIFTVTGLEEGAIATRAGMHSLAAFQRRLNAIHGVGKTLSVADTVERLHAVLGNERSKLPDSTQLISQYLFLYSLSGGDDLGTRITADYRTAKVVAMIREDSTSLGERIIAEARTIAREEFPEDFSLGVAGSLASNAALTEVMVKGKALNVLQIGAITILVSSLIFRSIIAGVLVAIPLAIAVLVNLGVMGLLGIRMDISTSTVTAMAVGIGADYAVYFLFRLREEFRTIGNYELALTNAMTTSGKAVLFVSSAIGLGYSVLCLSSFRLFVQLGSLVGLAMVSSSLTTLLILPALVTKLGEVGGQRILLGSGASSAATQRRSA